MIRPNIVFVSLANVSEQNLPYGAGLHMPWRLMGSA